MNAHMHVWKIMGHCEQQKSNLCVGLLRRTDMVCVVIRCCMAKAVEVNEQIFCSHAEYSLFILFFLVDIIILAVGSY